MYFLFRLHHKFPHDYFNLPKDEKLIVRCFLTQELADLKKENEAG